MHYKEVCERNIILEKLLKRGSSDIYDQDYKSKKEKETLENLFSSEISTKNNGNNEGNNNHNYNNNNINNNQSDNLFVINTKVNIPKLRISKKINTFLNNNYLNFGKNKEVIEEEMKIQKQKSLKTTQPISLNNSLLSDYNSDNYMDSNRTERIDTFGNYDSSVNTNNENKKKNDFSSKHKRSSFSSQNSNNSASCYESNFETYKNQIINDNFNSNTYEVLKYVDNNNAATNQTNKAAEPSNSNQNNKRRYDYESNIFETNNTNKN